MILRFPSKTLGHAASSPSNDSPRKPGRAPTIEAKLDPLIGSADAGWRSAVIYTLVEQVMRHGHDPFAYSKWVFERLPGMTNQDDFAPLLPCNWVATQGELQSRAA